MHLFGGFGILLFSSGMLVNVYLLIVKFGFGQDIWGRPLLILGTILLLGGIQFITMGIISELMMRTYFESQNKKTYRLKETVIGKD